jgi:hypothetical protein
MVKNCSDSVARIGLRLVVLQEIYLTSSTLKPLLVKQYLGMALLGIDMAFRSMDARIYWLVQERGLTDGVS